MFQDIGKQFLEQREAGTLVPEVLEPIAAAGTAKASASVSTEFKIDVHGETYQVEITGVGGDNSGKRHIYLTLDGMPEEVLFESLNEYDGGAATGNKRGKASGPGDITTAMPGNIVDVLVNVGDEVTAGQAVLITEAMKMETEIQAPIAGKVAGVHVTKGDRVTPGETLIEIVPH